MQVSVDDPLFAVILLAALLTLRLCMFLIERAYRWAARTSQHVQNASFPDYLDDLLDLIAVLLLGFGGILAEGIVVRVVQADGPTVETLRLFSLGFWKGDASWALQRLLIIAFILPFVFLRVGWDLGRLRYGWKLWPLSTREREMNRALTLTFVALFCLTWLPLTESTHLQVFTLMLAWIALALRIVWVPFVRSLNADRQECLSYQLTEDEESLSVFLAGFTGLLFLLGLAPWVTSENLRLVFTCVALVFYVPHAIWLAFHSSPAVDAPVPVSEALPEGTVETKAPSAEGEETLPQEKPVEHGAEVIAEEPAVMVIAPMDMVTSEDAGSAEQWTGKNAYPTDESKGSEVETQEEDLGAKVSVEEETAPAVVAPVTTRVGMLFRNPYHFWTELLDSAIVAVFLVFVLIRPFLLQAFYIPSPSMFPTLQDGDKLLATKVTLWMHPPQRGDICVFVAPELAVSTSGMPQDPEHPLEYVKRVIGLPGEHLKTIAYDGVYINGVKLSEPYLRTRDGLVKYNFPLEPNGSLSREFKDVPELLRNMEQYIVGDELVIPQGMIFMMGDNRNTSHDSHKWGPLRESAVLGEAFFVFWPPQRMGILH